jgi:voltage-gated sodium channel
MFIMCFCVELALRIYFQGLGRNGFFDDFSNDLDLALVSLAVVDMFVFIPAGAEFGGLIRLFTVLRTLRVVRLVRLVRMFKVFRELWLLVGGLVNSMKALGWVGIVVIVVLYVCSILVTTEIGQNDEVYGTGPSYDGTVWPYKEYFGTIWRSMFSLFQVLTLDNWCDDIVRHVIHRQPLMAIFFVVFLLLTAFGLMNVVIGIIVENTLAAAQVADSRVAQQQAYLRKKAVEKLEDHLVKSDVNRSGEISMEELQAAGQSPIVQKQFEAIGLKFEEAKEIFSLLDYGKCGRIELKRFAASCRELVGGARRRDIVQVEITVGTLAQRLDSLDQKFSSMEQEVFDLHNMADDFVHNTVRLLTGFDGL